MTFAGWDEPGDLHPGDGLLYPAAAPRAALILAHGAGAGQRSRFLIDAARALAERGISVATFDFPYIRAGRKIPDKAPALEASWRQTIEAAGGDPRLAELPLFIGGKSMGGRMASHVAAQDPRRLRGVIFFGYPLRPPGQPAKRRDAHLPSITVPMLFLQGTRDEFGGAAEIRALLPNLNREAELYEAANADHSFRRADMAAVYDAAAGFIIRHR
jgi:hypothetical protein